MEGEHCTCPIWPNIPHGNQFKRHCYISDVYRQIVTHIKSLNNQLWSLNVDVDFKISNACQNISLQVICSWGVIFLPLIIPNSYIQHHYYQRI